MTPVKRESIGRLNQRRLALSRWDYEGGAGAGGRPQIALGSTTPSSHSAFGRKAELAELKDRVMALERLVAMLLAGKSSPNPK